MSGFLKTILSRKKHLHHRLICLLSTPFLQVGVAVYISRGVARHYLGQTKIWVRSLAYVLEKCECKRQILYHFWATVTSNGSAAAMLWDHCPIYPVCLSVTLGYSGQTVNGWMKSATCYRGSPRSAHATLCYIGTHSPSFPKEWRTAARPFSAHVYCGQMAKWIKMQLGKRIVLDGDPASLQKGGTAPIFGHVYFGQNAGYIRIPLGTEAGLSLSLRDIVLDGDPAPLP